MVAQREAENTRVQLRKHHQASVKKGKFGKHSVELEEVRIFSPLLIAGRGSLIRGSLVPEIDGQIHR